MCTLPYEGASETLWMVHIPREMDQMLQRTRSECIGSCMQGGTTIALTNDAAGSWIPSTVCIRLMMHHTSNQHQKQRCALLAMVRPFCLFSHSMTNYVTHACLTVLTTKVWQRAMALFAEGLVGSPGRLSGMRQRIPTAMKILPLLEESCQEEVSLPK